jgi:hypothetical protein
MRTRGGIVGVGLVAVVSLLGAGNGIGPAVAAPNDHVRAPSTRPRASRTHKAEWATDVVAVKYRRDATPTDDAIGATGYARVRTAKGKAAAAAATLAADSTVAEVAPVFVRHASAISNDPLVVHQPYLTPLRLPEAWASSNGTGVVIAVLDTGVNEVADLAGRVLAGRDIVNSDAYPADDNGHGTMVAGVAAAATGNGVGIAGVAGAARILPVKVLDASGAGNDADIADGIAWATDHGATVINLSLGGYGSSPVLDAAIAYATSHNVVVVAAAGNDATDEPSYPAANTSVVAVSASDASGHMALFSNYGDYIDVAAPGWDIVGPDYQVPGQYDIESGTSFSSPIVAGVAALVRSTNPTMSAVQVAKRVIDTAADAGPDGRDRYFGAGVVNAWAALGGPVVDPVIAAPAGDAHEPNDSPDHATVLAPTGSTNGTIGLPGDGDWYAIDVTSLGNLVITVSAPAWADTNPETLDAVVTSYSPTFARTGSADVNEGPGTGEVLTIPVAVAQRVYVNVANWFPTGSGGSYAVSSSFTSAPAAAPASAPADLAIRSATPDNNTAAAASVHPVVRFAAGSPATTTLSRADTGAAVPTVATTTGDTVTLTPTTPLVPAPYVVRVSGTEVSRFTVARPEWAPFATATGLASQMYTDVLTHAGSSSLTSWLGDIVQTNHMDPALFADSFLSNKEFMTKVSPIIRLYLAYFHQAPSYIGLQNWVAALSNGSPLAAVSGWFWSASGMGTTLLQLSDAAFVDKAFRAVLSRPPSSSESAAWVSGLAAGRVVRSDVFLTLSQLPEYIVRFQPTVEVAAVYAGMLRRPASPVELLGWLRALSIGRTRAELVADVFRSTPYRARFGPV